MFPADENQKRLADEFMLAARDMTIGFLKITQHAGDDTYAGYEEGIPAGTGTLAKVGSIHGVLTAAHVLDELPKHGKVGIVRITNRPDQPQKLKIDMELTDRLLIGIAPFNKQSGPDLGFLKLHGDVVGWLGAKGGNFFNLEKRAEIIPSRPESQPYYDALIGIVAERTQTLPDTLKDATLLEIQALFASGVARERKTDGFDLLEFETFLPPEKQPNSYQGTSGGGLWRLYLDPDEQQIRDRALIGVAFYESKLDGGMTLTCHGPKSIYSDMIARIRAHWPN
ncbi:hypothetical protein [Mesorhizobium sp. L-8-3]|uniref:hypothetical protein n=1 Tax=Mesorhizobium sp. L-8-3 TaxID=2744522 RepID=UPI0019256B74|nr:hypothetical protein [Mesorhizobium sp. L-8-3]BCH26115.1 hypothetical protein MesoLjLb_59000 [Mesorhizobium sp. L-8-3]